MHPLPLETQTLYAELLEHLLALEASRSLGSLEGSFITKKVKGETYTYFQASMPGGQTKQLYVGKEGATRGLLERFKAERADREDDSTRSERLAAQLRVGGAAVMDHGSSRVVKALADAGVFASGGVLVGTHAFGVLGNLLGYAWDSHALRTQDLDVGTTRAIDVDIAIDDTGADVPKVLEQLEMGFFPVPPLDPRKASTSFKVRGQGLRVDLVCPRKDRNDDPVYIRRWNAAAQPLDHLEHLLKGPERAVVVAGHPTLVNVPSPARFAFHKLLVSQMRPAAFSAKSVKDVAQAAQVFSVLLDSRPGDLRLTWKALVAHQGTARLLGRGLTALKKQFPEIFEALDKRLGKASRTG